MAKIINSRTQITGKMTKDVITQIAQARLVEMVELQQMVDQLDPSRVFAKNIRTLTEAMDKLLEDYPDDAPHNELKELVDGCVRDLFDGLPVPE